MKKLLLLLMILILPLVTFADEISLSWNASPSPDVIGYKIYYNHAGSDSPFDGIGADQGDSPIDVGNHSTVTLTGIPSSEPIYFTATAYDSAGYESSYSNVVHTPLPVPLAPQLTYTTAGTRITVTWTTVDYARGYRLYYAPYTDPMPSGPIAIGDLDMKEQTHFSIELWHGAAYYLAITAYNETGQSDFSNIEQFTLDATLHQ